MNGIIFSERIVDGGDGVPREFSISSMRFSILTHEIRLNFYIARCCEPYARQKIKIKISSYLSKTLL